MIDIALKIIRKDLRRHLNEPTVLILLLTFPLILTLIVGMAFSPMSEGRMPRTELLIADNDRGALSRFIGSAFRQAREGAPPVDLREVTEIEGREAIRKGEGSALLIVPEGFSEDYLGGRRTRLVLLKNPSESVLPEIAEQYADILAMTGSFVSRFFDDDREVIRELVRAESSEARLGWSLLRLLSLERLRAVNRYLMPLRVALEAPAETPAPGPDGHGGPRVATSEPESAFNIYEHILPGLSVFGILFLAQAVFRDVYTESEQGTLSRMLTTPASVGAFLLGKSAGGYLISLGGLLALQLLSHLAYGVDWGPPAQLLLLDVIAIVGVSGLCLLVFSLASSPSQGESMLAALIVFMALFGGSLVPLGQLPPSLRKIADFTLNGNLIAGYNSLIFRGSLLPVWPRLVTIAGLGGLCFLTGVLLLRQRYRSRL